MLFRSLFKSRSDVSANEAAVTGASGKHTDSNSPLDRREQRRLEAEQRQRRSALRKPLEKRLQEVEAAIASAEEAQVTVEAALLEEDLYNAARKEDLKQLLVQQVDNRRQLDTLEVEWLQLQEAMEQLEKS